jgi:hypothetical protein
MHRVLLTCSNCDQGAADRYWWLVGLGLVISIVAAVVLLVRLRSADRKLRIFGGLAVVVLAVGIVWSLSTLTTRIRVTVEGTTVDCSSALTSAETRGVPNDAALDPNQRNCRQAARRHLRNDLPVPVSVAVVGLLATLAGIGLSLPRSPARLPRTDQSAQP